MNHPEVDYSYLPEHMREGARDYVEKGEKPGGFLRAVLSNDLVEAFGYADATNYASMHLWARWLFNEAPADCWGSPAKVKAWLAKFNPTGPCPMTSSITGHPCLLADGHEQYSPSRFHKFAP